ncbi:LOW QUALITY PROTEIN: hypothetical protein Cgig2_019136 [Carnegiea gigantea]|uniref:Uncharacterized protein n=1 Tax=Carnegiea gigantea TaxID=171969 RepID=A0A9Q1JT56_9CARY|nr:LOW QUALITY PROTEIN: hypothetical protein Cgig2_019136 [Carnegiea gigantea]
MVLIPWLVRLSYSLLVSLKINSRRNLMSTQMESSCEAFLKSQALKEERNTLYRTKAYRSALNRYEKSIQYLCMVVPRVTIKHMRQRSLQLRSVSKGTSPSDLGLKAEARQDFLVALGFDPNNEEELQRIEEMCNVSKEKDIVKDTEVNGNNFIESSSKQVGQLAFDPIKLQVSSAYDKISSNSGSLGPTDPFAKMGKVQHVDGKDDSSAHIEDTKLCIEGDRSSSRSSMRVKEIDHMEGLSVEACSSIGTNMEFEEQNTNPKSMPPDMTSVKNQDYPMMLAPISNSKLAHRNVVYKPIGNTTRRCSLKLLCLSKAAYQRIE